MTYLKALLAATILGVTCAALAAGALAAGHARTSLAPKAKSAHHHKRAKAACKRKHHAKRSHKCHARKSRAGHTSHAADRSAPQSGRRTSSTAAPRTAKPASHHPTGSRLHQEAPTTVTVTVGASASATIASVLATPCQNTELTPEAGNLEAVERATVCLVNQERARNGELPLQLNAKLAQAAEGHVQEMVSEDYFAHVAPDGETPLQRVEATGYIPNSQVGYTLGENIAWGTLYLATPKAIVAAWIASPEHLANILNSAYTETAMGVAAGAPASLAEGQQGAIYAQEFGVIEA